MTLTDATSTTEPINDRVPYNELLRYALYGIAFGLLFPIAATWIRISLLHLPLNMASVVSIQQNDPLLWIIDSAPIFLGVFSSLVGRRQDILQKMNQKLELREQELRIAHTTLEQRITERTLELERANKQSSERASRLQTIIELSEAISRIDDLSELFPITTTLINERFGFYHIGIFLIDNEREFAILQAANSEGGQKMLARNHRLKLGTGVVGYAAKTGQPRIALDVGIDAVYFNNPDLPNTHSEVALPMKVRDETVGVLDVQSEEKGAFTTEDLQVLTALANQVSVMLENARLLSETRSALSQVEEVYNEFTRIEWTRTLSRVEQSGFRYQAGRIEILENGLENPEAVTAMQSGQTTKDAKSLKTVAVPVKWRGDVIGVLHVDSNDPSKEWRPDEVSLIEAVAERAAFAMENARLYQDARRRAAKEKLISEASASISGVLDLENILQITATELGRALGGSDVLIQFQSKESK